MLFKTSWFLILIIFFAFAGCYPVPESDLYETGGVASMSVENAEYNEKWAIVNHYTSTALLLESSEVSNITFQVYIQTPGTYSLWILSAMKDDSFGDEPVVITLSNSDGFLQYHGRILPNVSEYLTWSRTHI